MSYSVINNFSAGLDVRKPMVDGTEGTLYNLVNAHITRGGRIERRKKFIQDATLPSNTFGLFSVADTLYTFGSTAPGTITLPAGYTYQQLAHPDGATPMTSLLYVESFDGKVYAIAGFGDTTTHHYYDGNLVQGWDAGIASPWQTSSSDMATHLTSLFSGDPNFSASVVGNVITVTGPVGKAFTPSGIYVHKYSEARTDTATYTYGHVEVVTDVNGKLSTSNVATTLGAIIPAQTQVAVPAVTETVAAGAFSIVQGIANPGVNQITQITVHGVNLLSAAIDWQTSNTYTALAVIAAINARTGTTNYSASLASDQYTVLISAAAGTGSAPNGYAVVVTVSGSVTICTGSVTITSGTSTPGVNQIQSIQVNGVATMAGTAVNWTTDNTTTAAAVVAVINAHTGTTNVSAFNIGPQIYFNYSTLTSGTPLNYAIRVFTGGNVTVELTNGVLSTTIKDLSGGTTAVAGQSQKVTYTLDNAYFAQTRKYSIALLMDGTTYYYGAQGNPTDKGTLAMTFKSKVYSLSGSDLNFSAASNASEWSSNAVDFAGAGFINMATQDQGSATLTALGTYQGQLAVFARRVIQLWAIDADPTNNTFLAPVKNTGTRSPHSVLPFGNNDLFYFDADSGIRSLRARDASNAAFVSDVGSAIDPLIRTYTATLTDNQIIAANAVLEPLDDRYWLALGTTIFVFSYFPAAQISAWSTYDITDDVGGPVDWWAKVGTKLYCRSGNNTFLYGGADGQHYPTGTECAVQIQLPFAAAGQPATFKNLASYDQAAVGTWHVYIKCDPNDTTVEIDAGIMTGTTYSQQRQPIAVTGTHFAPRLVCNTPGYAALDQIALGYDGVGGATE